MHTCSSCKMSVGGMDKPPVYAFEGNDYCKRCMDSVNIGNRMAIDKAQTESELFLRRVRTGTYMKPREDILGYGKK